MSKRDKLRRKLRNNPRNVRFSDLETLLLGFGLILIRVTGSHHVFQYRKNDHEIIMVVPVHGNRVKAAYVIEAIAMLDQLFPEGEETTGLSEADQDDE